MSGSSSSLYAELDRRYSKKFDAALERLTTQVLDMVAEFGNATHRIGRLTLPAIILGGTNTQTLTWSKPMPTASYEVAVQQGATIIGTVTTAVTVKTAAAVTVQTTAGLAVPLGAELLIVAWTGS